jgi:hypothetical protein
MGNEARATFVSGGNAVCHRRVWCDHDAEGKNDERADRLDDRDDEPSAGRSRLHRARFVGLT